MSVEWVQIGNCRLACGDCRDVLPTLSPGEVDAVVTDPPYGMDANIDSTRFTHGENEGRYGKGRDDWALIEGDDEPFDPAPFLQYPKVVLWGSNHYAARLPVGTSLVWVKKADHLFGTFLSDAEIAWMKGGHGVYCYRKQFPPPSRMAESGNGRVAHPMQKPIGLMAWCMDRAKVTEGETVLDPFAGSGTVGVACVRTGRRYIGIEKQPAYFEQMVRRIRRAVSEAKCDLFAGVA